MGERVEILRRILLDVLQFAQHGSGLTLRAYQCEVARQVVRSVVEGLGLSLVVVFPRQSGKNELQAQIETYLLALYSGLGIEMVKVSPTWKPQSLNAMRRLERVLGRNIITFAKCEAILLSYSFWIDMEGVAGHHTQYPIRVKNC